MRKPKGNTLKQGYLICGWSDNGLLNGQTIKTPSVMVNYKFGEPRVCQFTEDVGQYTSRIHAGVNWAVIRFFVDQETFDLLSVDPTILIIESSDSDTTEDTKSLDLILDGNFENAELLRIKNFAINQLGLTTDDINQIASDGVTKKVILNNFKTKAKQL